MSDDAKSTEEFDHRYYEARRRTEQLLSELASGVAPTNPFRPRTILPTFDPRAIPKRPWVVDRTVLRGYITQLVAPPGTGKSFFALTLAVSIATGIPLLHQSRKPHEAIPVLFLNNEDDDNEIDRRISGLMQHYELRPEELTDKLYIISGYGSPYLIAETDARKNIVGTSTKNEIIKFCLEKNIGAIVLDPFVSTHDTDENDNSKMEKVMSQYRSIAKEGNVAVILVHHVRKSSGKSESRPGDLDSGRGASSVIGGARIGFTLAGMKKGSAQDLKIPWEIGRHLVRLDNAKQNFSIKDEDAEWYELRSVQLPNTDWVAAIQPFEISTFERQHEIEKAKAKAEVEEERLKHILQLIIKHMDKDEISQSQITNLIVESTSREKTSVYEDMGLLPSEPSKAAFATADQQTYRIWRRNTGTPRAPRYQIHREKII